MSTLARPESTSSSRTVPACTR